MDRYFTIVETSLSFYSNEEVVKICDLCRFTGTATHATITSLTIAAGHIGSFRVDSANGFVREADGTGWTSASLVKFVCLSVLCEDTSIKRPFVSSPKSLCSVIFVFTACVGMEQQSE